MFKKCGLAGLLVALAAVGFGQGGTLVSWGADSYGDVSGTPSGSFTAVAAGVYHNVAIRTDGTLDSWGSDLYGEVSGTPTGTFTAVAAGDGYSVAVRTDGTLVSWGNDSAGQVTDTPTGTFTAVSAGFDHSVAIRTDGTLVSWGPDFYGLVSGTPAGTFKAVSAGAYGSAAIRTDGTLVSWGYDAFGEVTNTPAGTFKAVAAGYSPVAIRTDGTLVSWGIDEGGEVTDTPTGTFTAVAGDYSCSLAIRTDGTLASWGGGEFGQVSGTPTGTFTAVAAGADHIVAISGGVGLQSISLSPHTVVGGTAAPGAVVGTALLTGAAPQGGVTVSLSALATPWPPLEPDFEIPAPLVVGAIDPVNIASGSDSGLFSLTTSQVLFPIVVQVTGRVGAGLSRHDTLTVLPPTIPQFGRLANDRVDAILSFFFRGRSRTSLIDNDFVFGEVIECRNMPGDPLANQDIYLAAADHYLEAAVDVGNAPASIRALLAPFYGVRNLGYETFKVIYRILPTAAQQWLADRFPDLLGNPSPATLLSVQYEMVGLVAGLHMT